MAMATGKVLRFNAAMGHGYTKPSDGKTDVPVRQFAVELAGYKTLKRGQAVRYDLSPGLDGKLRVAALKLID
jgi:CspA family cold shock protein